MHGIALSAIVLMGAVIFVVPTLKRWLLGLLPWLPTSSSLVPSYAIALTSGTQLLYELYVPEAVLRTWDAA